MLRYKFDEVFKIRGITRPYTYLTQQGIQNQMASRIVKNELGSIRLKTLEKICIALNCTPNDLLEWYPSEGFVNDKRLALHAIKAKDPEHTTKITRLLHDIPLDKLEEVEAFIEGRIKPDNTNP